MKSNAAPVGGDLELSGSHAVRAQLRLREMILAGELPAGGRIAELALVERLGVSRTPIRAALIRLEQEGLLHVLPGGGYAVRTFTEADVADAIELRGTVEGLVARLAAERGAPAEVLAGARATLDEIDALLREPALNEQAFSSYVRLNEQFHTQLAALCGSGLLARELERVMGLPFASPSAFVLQHADTPQSRDMLVVAQDQHRQVLEAIARGEGARAEALMREHSRIAQRNLRQALQGQAPVGHASVHLIRPRKRAQPAPEL